MDLTTEFLDAKLDAILRASGSSLKNYSMQKTKDDMRSALSFAICEALTDYSIEIKAMVEAQIQKGIAMKSEAVIKKLTEERDAALAGPWVKTYSGGIPNFTTGGGSGYRIGSDGIEAFGARE